MSDDSRAAGPGVPERPAESGVGHRRRWHRGVMRASAGLYRGLLWLYPPGFRREWGGPMLAVFLRCSVERHRRHGAGALVRWWWRMATDLAWSVVAEWGEAWRGRRDARWAGTVPQANHRGKRSGVVTMTGGVAGEVRYALRRYLRTPTWTLAALATLAVGTGAFTGMVSLVWQSLVRPLPFQQPGELEEITAVPADSDRPARRWSLNLLETWQQERAGGISVGGWAMTRTPMELGRGAEYLDGGTVTGNLMEILGVRPVLGRRLEEADGHEGAAPVAVLDEDFWRREFGADPGVVGRSLQLGSERATVVGVVGPELRTLVPEARIWLTTGSFPRSPYLTVLRAVGRRPPGTSEAAVRARLAAVRVTDAAGSVFSGRAQPFRDVLVKDARPLLLTFLAVVTGLLLVGAVNLANLFLGRAVTLARDLGIRRALGAGRARLVRDAMVDGGVLGILGGASGLLLGLWLRHLVVRASPAPIPALRPGPTGPPEVAVALGVAVLLCTLLSVWTTLAEVATAAARPGSTRGGTDSRFLRRVQGGLTVVQVGATFVLLVGSALLVRTFAHLSAVDPGFDTKPVGAMELSIPATYPDTESLGVFTRRLVDEVRSLPGVTGAAAVDRPLIHSLAKTHIQVEGVDSLEFQGQSVVVEVQPGFLEVMGIPLLRGRPLRETDQRGTAPVAVVSRAFVARYLLGGNPLGRRFRQEGGPWITVVGVSGDLRAAGPSQDVEPVMFRSLEQTNDWTNFVSVVFRAPAGAAPLLAPARARLRTLEPEAPVRGLGTYAQILREAPGFADSRFRALVVGLLGVVALVLAVVGVYGVTAYSVRCRTRELGIRIALGGGEGKVLRAVLGEGLRLAVLGAVLGGAVAWFLVGALQGFLADLPARDPRVFLVVGAALALVALAACARPALAAARVSPAEALRTE